MHAIIMAALRAEYTKLRSAAMKRYKRAVLKDLAWLPGISGVQFDLPALRMLSQEDWDSEEVVSHLIQKARAFLKAPTTIKDLKKAAKELRKNMLNVAPVFAEFLNIDGGKQFFLYYQQASATAQGYISYMEGKPRVMSHWDELAMDYIRRDFTEWRRLNGYLD